MGRLQAKSDYESVRKARILENQVSLSHCNIFFTQRMKSSRSKYHLLRVFQNRLKTLGLQKTVSELRSIVSSSNSPKTHVRSYTKKKVYEIGSLRRSNRLKQISPEKITPKRTSLRRSSRFREDGKSGEPISGFFNLFHLRYVLQLREEWTLWKKGNLCVFFSPFDLAKKRVVEEGSPRPANMPLVVIKGSEVAQLSPEASAVRCSSRGRGGVYDSVFGICCHFCRFLCFCPFGFCVGKAD